MSRITVDSPPGLEDWAPLSPTRIDPLFQDFPGIWCIAGGSAIDLVAGGQARHHEDIDIQICRATLPMLHQHLPGWLLYAADGGLTLREEDTPLPKDIHEIWYRSHGNQWEFQLMVVELNDHEWVFRR